MNVSLKIVCRFWLFVYCKLFVQFQTWQKRYWHCSIFFTGTNTSRNENKVKLAVTVSQPQYTCGKEQWGGFFVFWVLFYTQQVWKLLIQTQYNIGIFTIQHSCNTHNGSTSSVPIPWKSTCMHMVFKGLWYYSFVLQDSKRTAPCDAEAQERMLRSQKLQVCTTLGLSGSYALYSLYPTQIFTSFQSLLPFSLVYV